MVAGSGSKRLEVEIIWQREKPTDLIETKQPLKAANRGWLKPILCHLR